MPAPVETSLGPPGTDSPLPTSSEQILGPDDVASALRTYRGRPDLYSLRLIVTLRKRLGLGPGDGDGIAEDLAQATATFQASARGKIGLRVTGVADASTLARLFPKGFNTEEQASRYRQATRPILRDWFNLTPAQRIKAGWAEVTKQLSDLGIPLPELRTADLGLALGEFRDSGWTVAVNLREFGPAATTGPVDALATLYHEAQHAEQIFLIVQELLSRYWTTPDPVKRVSAMYNLPLAVIEAAHQVSYDPGSPRAALARMWLDEVTTNPPGLVKSTRRRSVAEADLDAAELAFRADPSEQNRDRWANARLYATEARIEHYTDHPMENDAEATSNRIEGSPQSDPALHDPPPSDLMLPALTSSEQFLSPEQAETGETESRNPELP